MKKLIGFLLIAFGLFVLLVTSFSVFSSRSTANQGNEFKKDMSDFESMELSSVNVDWEIERYDGKEIVVALNNANKVNIYSQLRGKTLKIELKDERFKWMVFQFSGRGTAKVLIPYEYDLPLTIRNVSGNIRIDQDLSADRLFLKTVSGNIEALTLTANNIEVVTTSGNVEVQGMVAENNKIETVSGQIEAKQVTGELDAESVSGDINLQFSEEQSQTKVKTISGDIQLMIPNANASFNLTTLSGDIVTGSNFTGILGNGLNPFNIQTVSGDIHIVEQ
ncbi:DUF4097 family beta strand repeat-containing protein [Halalkalibacter akibai]|uniref:DUF4097 domain-containing protein n=1 Tax=Halalkalibacter akibai (strain ATCC 43226 / DSM 21942 / CIP 109018 / JCM 9157 / 1139) TaxID=1236973 RepID=W4QUU7_HALA3|nr:DUF4097 family beta strand repeat-containing protein [Halalkalibacter akibai]GAE35687.1 hypothetical protein JCM9157_2804 [Halalkalibacter akibai JCM 9157]